MKVLDLISEYQNNYPIYKDFTQELKSVIEKKLVVNSISYSQIEARIKTLPSFLNKAYRLISQNNHYSPLFNDLIGVRIIAFYNKDVHQIANLIEKEFEIHSINSEYESQNRSPDQFGYSSKHYKLSLSAKDSTTKKLKKFKNIIFEVQIRTVVQHAWSTIDHKIRYKTAEKIPNDIQREIFQLSALFELADSQFLAIKEKLETVERKDVQQYKKGDPSVKINSATLDYFFQTHEGLIQFISDEAKAIGFKETKIQHDPNSIRNLLVVFQRLGIKTVGELEALFEQASRDGTEIMKKIYQVISQKSEIAIEYPLPIMLLILITLRLKKIKFNDIDTDKVVPKLLKSSVKSISMSVSLNNAKE